ncbi:MAG: hypothetical protein HY716_08370 [Planctomycetes bacterium]|nr:hypothetical protein [Planctomycetota bacterium]
MAAGVGVLWLACSLRAWAAQEPAQEETPKPAPEKPTQNEYFGIPVSGTFSTKYRGRWTSEDRDQDLFHYLSVDFGDPARQDVTGHLLLRATQDVDGDRNPDEFFAFTDITNTFSNRNNGRLYYAYLDVTHAGPLDLARAGRQFLYETPALFYFDGFRLDSKPCAEVKNLQVGLYGGVPVHMYESSAGGDLLAGAYLEAQPWKGAKARVDYARIRDDYLFGTQRDDLWGASLRQSLGEILILHGQYTRLEAESRDLLLRANFYERSLDLRVDLSWYHLYNSQKILSIETDFFFSSAFDYFPYDQARLLVAKGVGEYLVVQGGVDVRELDDDAKEATFNREFRRFYLTPVFSNWPVPGLSLSLTGEAWEVPGTDNGDIRTGGFDVSHAYSPQLKLSAGVAYALFKYDFFANLERERVRTVYGKITYKDLNGFKLDVAYELEHDSLDDFRTLKVGAAYSF